MARLPKQLSIDTGALVAMGVDPWEMTGRTLVNTVRIIELCEDYHG